MADAPVWSAERATAVVAALRAGALLVYPTETVYGIGTALSAGDVGVERIRAAKGSPPGRPFLVLVADADAALALWSRTPPAARPYVAEWPAPLTLIGPARAGLPGELLGRRGDVATISVRVPDHGPLRALLAELGEPLVSTSANVAGGEPSARLEAVDLEALNPDLVLDGGACPGGVPSTLIDVVGAPKILRAGAWVPAESR